MSDERVESIKRIVQLPVFVDDVQTMYGISDELFEEAVSALGQAKEGPDSIYILLKNVLADAHAAKAFTNFLVNFSKIRAAYQLSPQGFVEKYGGVILQELKGLSADNYADKFHNRLPALVGDYPALSLYIKSQDLKDEGAITLERFRILCDLRPIFTDEVDTFKALIIHTTLHIQYDISGTSKGLDIQVTEKQVEDLLKQLTRAKKKLSLLKKYVDTLDLTNSATVENPESRAIQSKA